jgi:hypothetical protein
MVTVPPTPPPVSAALLVCWVCVVARAACAVRPCGYRAGEAVRAGAAGPPARPGLVRCGAQPLVLRLCPRSLLCAGAPLRRPTPRAHLCAVVWKPKGVGAAFALPPQHAPPYWTGALAHAAHSSIPLCAPRCCRSAAGPQRSRRIRCGGGKSAVPLDVQREPHPPQ